MLRNKQVKKCARRIKTYQTLLKLLNFLKRNPELMEMSNIFLDTEMQNYKHVSSSQIS